MVLRMTMLTPSKIPPTTKKKNAIKKCGEGEAENAKAKSRHHVEKHFSGDFVWSGLVAR